MNLVTEDFSPTEVEDVILDNQDLVEGRGECFSVDREILNQIFNNMKSSNEIDDKRTRIIKKSAHLLAGISYYQPFREGNKETALSLTISFLRRNGLILPLNTKKEKKDIYEILVGTSLKFENDRTIVNEVEEYLSEKVVQLSY